VPIVFNIRPYHTDSTTRPNIKHRVSALSASASGAQTPALFVDPKQFPVGYFAGGQANASGNVQLPRTVDEQADSAARKALMHFGPNNNPRLEIGYVDLALERELALTHFWSARGTRSSSTRAERST